jgi:hypothetical protein
MDLSSSSGLEGRKASILLDPVDRPKTSKNAQPIHIHPEDGNCNVCRKGWITFNIRHGSFLKAEVVFESINWIYRPTDSSSSNII